MSAADKVELWRELDELLALIEHTHERVYAGGVEEHVLARLDVDLQEANRIVKSVRARVQARLRVILPPREYGAPNEHNIDGHVVRRKNGGQYVNWADDDLLRAVLDSRLVDPDTGEVADETPADKLRDVYPMPGRNARTGRMKARGLEPKDFATWQGDKDKIDVSPA